MTTGHLRKLFLACFKEGKASDWTHCDVILVDEVHTGSKDNSIVLDLWVEMRKQGVKVPRLVMATATSAGMDSMIKRFDAIVYKSEMRRFPIKQKYSTKNYTTKDDDLIFEDTIGEAISFLTSMKTHGLVFCSGSGECEDIIHGLQQSIETHGLAEKLKKNIEVLPCYSQCKREQIMTAITEAPKDTIHIVVATNVAESSLTIPDVAWVIDMMTEKRSSIVGGKFHLGVEWISKNSADQRAGRTGRTLKNGVCLRMMHKDAYDRLIPFRPLEIRSSPISDVLIELLDIGLDPTKVISDLDQTRLEEAKKVLIETECIVLGSSGLLKTAKVTNCGRFVAKMPMDVHNAAAFYHCYGDSSTGEDNYFWEVAMAVLIDTHGPSMFWMPRKEKNQSFPEYNAVLEGHTDKYFSEYESSSPVLSLLLGFADCMNDHSERNINTAPWRFGKWAKAHSFNNKKLKEVCASLKRVIRLLQTYGYRCDYEKSYKEELKDAHDEFIENGFMKVYKSKEISYRPRFRGPSHFDKMERPILIDSSKTVVDDSPERCYSLSEISIENKKTKKITIISSLWFPAPSW